MGFSLLLDDFIISLKGYETCNINRHKGAGDFDFFFSVSPVATIFGKV